MEGSVPVLCVRKIWDVVRPIWLANVRKTTGNGATPWAQLQPPQITPSCGSHWTKAVSVCWDGEKRLQRRATCPREAFAAPDLRRMGIFLAAFLLLLKAWSLVSPGRAVRCCSTPNTTSVWRRPSIIEPRFKKFSITLMNYCISFGSCISVAFLQLYLKCWNVFL